MAKKRCESCLVQAPAGRGHAGFGARAIVAASRRDGAELEGNVVTSCDRTLLTALRVRQQRTTLARPQAWDAEQGPPRSEGGGKVRSASEGCPC